MFDLAARARRPSVHRMTPALAALGVESMTSAFIHSVQGASVLLFGSVPFRATEAISVAAYAVGLLFAFGSARWRGSVAAVLLFAVLWVEQFWLSIPARQAFCAQSGTSCDLLALAWPGLWPGLLGVALGILAGRAVRQGAPGLSAVVLGIGVAGLAFPLGQGRHRAVPRRERNRSRRLGGAELDHRRSSARRCRPWSCRRSLRPVASGRRDRRRGLLHRPVAPAGSALGWSNRHRGWASSLSGIGS